MDRNVGGTKRRVVVAVVLVALVMSAAAAEAAAKTVNVTSGNYAGKTSERGAVTFKIANRRIIGFLTYDGYNGSCGQGGGPGFKISITKRNIPINAAGKFSTGITLAGTGQVGAQRHRHTHRHRCREPSHRHDRQPDPGTPYGPANTATTRPSQQRRREHRGERVANERLWISRSVPALFDRTWPLPNIAILRQATQPNRQLRRPPTGPPASGVSRLEGHPHSGDGCPHRFL